MHALYSTGGGGDDEAAFWFARMRSDSVSRRDRLRFSRWLNAHPDHASAYAEYQVLWDGLGDVAGEEPVLAMRKEALSLGAEPQRDHWPKLTAIAATLAMFLIAGALLLNGSPQAGPEHGLAIAEARDPSIYRTEVGQRSTITLTDGSVVELNTDSVLQVMYSDGRRGLRLLRGQALFEVAHDAARPFVVEAAGQLITALGTRFDVRLRSGEMRVTLLEGEIAVERDEESSGDPASQARRLRPGEQLIAAPEQPLLVRNIDAGQAVSWTTGRVIFTDEPLGQVIQEINRYSARKVVLGDSTLAGMRISGVFKAGSVNSFVAAIDAAFPVASQYDEAQNRIILVRE